MKKIFQLQRDEYFYHDYKLYQVAQPYSVLVGLKTTCGSYFMQPNESVMVVFSFMPKEGLGCTYDHAVNYITHSTFGFSAL